jgi:hypothetical protein
MILYEFRSAPVRGAYAAIALLMTMFFMLWCAASASAAFSSPQPISGADAATKGPAVAQDSSSSQIVAWVRASDKHVLARRVTDAGVLGNTLDLSSEADKSDTTPAVATADPTGAVTVVWMRAADQHVVAVRIPAGGAPGSVIDVSGGMVAASSQSNAAADGLGNVHVVWRNGSNSHVTSRTLSPGGSVGSATDVSATDPEAALWGTAPNVTADASGNRFFTYHRNTDCHIMLRALSSAGVLGPAIDVSQQPFKAVGDTSPSVATAGGNVVLVWHRDGDIYDHADDTVYFNFVTGGTTPGTPTQLSADGDVSMMGIGISGGPDGNFGVTWQGRTSAEVWYRGIGSNGAPLGSPQQLSSGASKADGAPAVGIGPSAGTAVAWSAADGTVNLTSSTGTYSPPPVIPAIGKPTLYLVKGSVALKGTKLRFKVTCAGAACAGKAKFTDRKRKKVWAKGAFSLGVGKTTQFTVKLNAKARAKLRKSGSLKGYLSVSVTGGSSTGAAVKLRRR